MTSVSSIGLTVEFPTPCRTCRRSFMATIGTGNDQHPASVRCKACNVHRGWMSHEHSQLHRRDHQELWNPHLTDRDAVG